MLSSGGALSGTSFEMSPAALVAVFAPVVGLDVPKSPDMMSQVSGRIQVRELDSGG